MAAARGAERLRAERAEEAGAAQVEQQPLVEQQPFELHAAAAERLHPPGAHAWSWAARAHRRRSAPPSARD